jgi:hypothetical protein
MARRYRSGTISRLRNQKTVLLDKINVRQTKLEEKLRAVVPENLRQWLKLDGNSLFHDLFESGKATHEVWDDSDDCTTYGFTSLKEFVGRFKELKTAWEKFIQIRIKWTKDYKIQITFKAL